MRRPQWLSVGIHDQGLDPALLVDVELFQLRYAVADLMEALSRPPESRLLSCTLNFAWPGKGLAEGAADAASILPRVSRAFAPLAKKTRAVASHEQDDDGRFSAWLSFADLAKAEEALNVAHAAFRAEGLGFYQWIREMTVPRDDS